MTQRDAILAIVRDGVYMEADGPSYPELLRRLRGCGCEPRGVMIDLQRLQGEGRVRLQTRFGAPWVSAELHQDEERDDGPMWIAPC